MVRQRGERGRALSDGSRAPQTNFGRHRDTYRLSAQQSRINGWTWKTPSFNLPTKAHMEQTTTFLPLLLFSFLTVSKREGLIYGSLLLCLIRITISNFTIALIYVTTPRQLQSCREIMTQSFRVGSCGPIFLQGDAWRLFFDFVSDFASIFTFKLKSANFGPLGCRLGELYIQNSLPWLPQICLGTCWSSFNGFCDIGFIAEK